MGMMKRYLMEKIEEWQRLHPQWTLEEIYQSSHLYEKATEYAQKELEKLAK